MLLNQRGKSPVYSGLKVNGSEQYPLLTCRAGRYNLDPDVKFFATPPTHGSLAKFVDHPEDFTFVLPDGVSYEEAAMVEPLSNGIQACRRAGVGPGKTLAILGAGPMGQCSLS